MHIKVYPPMKQKNLFELSPPAFGGLTASSMHFVMATWMILAAQRLVGG